MRINTATISLTNLCNFKCTHCSVNSGIKLENELSFTEIKDILLQLKKENVKNIELSGGEPLLRKDLYKIINYCKKLEFGVKILTNGSLLNKNNLRKLKKTGLDKIAISLDGSSYEIYKKIRPVKREIFNKVLENIKMAAESGIFVKVNTVAMKSNFKDIKDIIKLCENFGVRELRLCYLSKIGRAEKLNEAINSQLWLSFVKKLHSKNISIYFGLNYAGFNSGCLINQEIPLYISSIGDIFLCPLSNCAGNIRNATLKNIISTAKLNSCINSKKIKELFKICPLRKFSLDDIQNKTVI